MAIIFPQIDKKEYKICPEGTYIFKIYDAWENQNDTIIVQMVTADGKHHSEFYRLKKKDGSINDGALNAFAYFAKTALDDFDKESIETPAELNGHFIMGTIEHSEGQNGKTYARMTQKDPASGFNEEPTDHVKSLTAKHAVVTTFSEKPTNTEEKTSSVSIDDLL